MVLAHQFHELGRRLTGEFFKTIVESRFGIKTTFKGQGQNGKSFFLRIRSQSLKFLNAVSVNIVIEIFTFPFIDNLGKIVGMNAKTISKF